jgi:Nucleotidyl transferase AbiEii toxin, Type IV TA system
LFLDPNAFDSPLSSNQTDKVLKHIQAAVGEYPALKLLTTKQLGRSRSEKGISRTSDFEYDPKFSGNGAIQSRVLLEMGIRSGKYPIESVQLNSFLAEFLQGVGESLGAEDETSFPMRLLHFRRIFVEKLFSLHSKVTQYQLDGTSFANYTRHYYDLVCLAKCPETIAMLQSEEYIEIERDTDRISQVYFSNQYHPPQDLNFSSSSAFFPTGELRQEIANEYKQQCDTLCLSAYPAWEAVEQCFTELSQWL